MNYLDTQSVHLEGNFMISDLCIKLCSKMGSFANGMIKRIDVPTLKNISVIYYQYQTQTKEMERTSSTSSIYYRVSTNTFKKGLL